MRQILAGLLLLGLTGPAYAASPPAIQGSPIQELVAGIGLVALALSLLRRLWASR
jgi:hypothetical protein